MIWGYQRSIRKKGYANNNLKYIYNSHTEPLFKNPKLLKIEDMLKLQ